MICRTCGSNVPFYNIIGGECSACVHKAATLSAERAAIPAEAEKARLAEESLMLSRIVLSTEAAPDLRVAERLDIVTAEFAVGMGLLTDIFNAWRDVFGGRAKSYQNALKDARKAVLDELRREAHAIGADAVLGVSLDYSEISGGGKSMMFLVASGTAVRLEKPQ